MKKYYTDYNVRCYKKIEGLNFIPRVRIKYKKNFF